MKHKRFIEDSFPVKEVSEESAQEKNIRHGHICTMHTWWARRPLASSRATNYAALIPAPKDDKEREERKNFIIEFSKLENSLRQDLIERARKDILEANGGVLPKVLDPFAGGGAIPLEALRLGCETYASDLNPVAVLLLKCTLEYPQRYGKPVKRKVKVQQFGQEVEEEITVNPLLEDVEKWGEWVLNEAKKEIGRFYAEEKGGSIPVGYIWARTIPCQNPSCGAEIPLMRQYWLAKKEKKKVALHPYVEGGQVKFRIVGTGYEKMPKDFDPENGNVSRAVAVCPVCGSVVAAKDTRRLFQEGKSSQRMIALVTHNPDTTGKKYRIANEDDVKLYQEAEHCLQEKRERLKNEWGIDPVPDEPTPDGKGRGAERAFSIRNYGMFTWGDLFNTRQKLALVTFTEKVREAHKLILKEASEESYARAVVSYLALLVDELARFTAVLNPWKVDAEAIVHIWGRQALPMLWDYNENNPLGDHGGTWVNRTKSLINVVGNLFLGNESITVSQSSATRIPSPDGYFDAILTDPPYYDNVPYSHLSDFFYVWLKRSVGHLYPELFSTPLTPKKDEIVTYSNIPGGFDAGKRFFEDMLKKAFQEIYRVLKPNGIAVIVYAHKSTEGWETLINSLLDSGLIVSGAWPLNTEMGSRLRASESAALASSIYIMSHKLERAKVGFYNEVKEELKQNLSIKLTKLWGEGLSGADFFIAAIGSAIEVFGKYEKVMDYEGNVVRADRMLQDVREIATDYAVHQILHNGFAGEISDLTRFYVLFRWDYGEAKAQFDDAKKLAMSCGIDLAQEWNKHGFIQKEKEFIRVLGPQARKIDEVKGSTELVDVLHHVLLLWEKSKRQELLEVLEETGFGKSEAFYRVAQAISETLLIESKEKKLLDGFLAGRQRITSEIKTRVEEPKQEYLRFSGKKESGK